MGPEPPKHRSAFLEWNYDAEIFAFGKRIGEEFDENILRKALTHRSYVNKKEIEDLDRGQELPEKPVEDNKEMIKEGEGIIKRFLEQEFENKHPKVIAKAIVNHLMSQKTLAHVALHMGLKDIILCSDFPVEEVTLADSFKAIVTAVEASSNKERIEIFIRDFLVSQLNGKDIFELWDLRSPYKYLKTLAKEKGLSELEPRLCNESASNTILANYQVGVYCNKKLIGIGWGETIEIAKETAALDAIKKLHYDNIY